MQTVLITGCSTGFGGETALEFLDKGWNVVATMRDPTASTPPAAGHLQVLPLDVTDPDSIAAAVAATGLRPALQRSV
ncbi:SDR family NAD(P)-dependent oxidoreductase [Brevundimonas sp.]|uniref:SDR family NAD(P)-dependent oxidoreductase n=1 Tax=Brevundimonas sp. TaxID=1871086 RepID=UPI0035644846